MYTYPTILLLSIFFVVTVVTRASKFLTYINYSVIYLNQRKEILFIIICACYFCRTNRLASISH